MSNSSNIKPVLFGNNEPAMMRFASDNAAIVDRIVFDSDNYTVFINFGNSLSAETSVETVQTEVVPEKTVKLAETETKPAKRVRDYAAEKARRKANNKPAQKSVEAAPIANEAEEPESVEDDEDEGAGDIVPENDFTEPAKPNVRTHAIAPQGGKRKLRSLSELGANLRLGASHRKAH